jgi:hypothetical protein
MQLENPIESVAAALHQAALRDARPMIRPEVKYEPRKDRPGMDRVETGKMLEHRPEVYRLELFAMFAQMWSSTALGFGGIGGAAMTPAYTTIILGPERDFCVYFRGRFAYRIEKPNDFFFEDVGARSMVEVSAAEKRYAHFGTGQTPEIPL